jgi:hypothetical protein
LACLTLKHFEGDTVAVADQIALVTLDELADSAALNELALATNFEDELLWLVDVRSLAKLKRYGKALTVLWRSDKA